MAAEFTVVAEIDAQFSDAEIKRTADELQKKLASFLKPIELKIAAQQNAAVNASLKAMADNLKDVAKAQKEVEKGFAAIGAAATKAFNDAGRAKDRFRTNLSRLRDDLRATAAQAATTGSALSGAFSGLNTAGLASGIRSAVTTGLVSGFSSSVTAGLTQGLTAGLTTGLTASITSLEAIPVTLVPNTLLFEAELEALSKAPRFLTLLPNTLLFEAELEALLKAPHFIRLLANPEAILADLVALENTPITLKFLGDFSAIERKLQSFQNESIKVPVSPTPPSSPGASTRTATRTPAGSVPATTPHTPNNSPLEVAFIERMQAAVKESQAFIAEFDRQEATITTLNKSLKDFAQEALLAAINEQLIEDSLAATNVEIEKSIALQDRLTAARRRSSEAGSASVLNPGTPTLPPVAPPSPKRLDFGSQTGAIGLGPLGAIGDKINEIGTKALPVIKNLRSEVGSLLKIQGQNFLQGVKDFSIKDFASNAFKKAQASVIEFARTGTTELSAFNQGLLNVGNKITSTIGEALTNATKRLVQFGSIGVAVLGGLAVKGAANLEQLQVALTGLVGAANAPGAFKAITDFAAKTPFQVGDVTDAVIKLGASMGKSVPQALDFLTVIGNAGAAAGASADQINAAINAITQLSAAGKLNAQDLNQIGSAIPSIARTKVFEQIAADTKQTIGQVRGLADTGKISADVAIKAILEVAKNVPGALGAMERQSKTLNGVISTLKDNFNLLAFAVLKPAIGVFEDFISKVNFDKVTAGIQTFLKSAADALGPSLTKAFNNIKDLGPDLLSIFKSVGAVVVTLVKDLPAVTAALKPIFDIISVLAKAFAGIVLVINPVLQAVLKFATAALSFKPLLVIIEALAIKFVLLKTGLVGVFQGLVVGAAQAFAGLKNFATGAEGAAGVSTLFKTGLSGIVSGLASILSPMNIAIAGFLLYKNAVDGAKAAQDKLFAKSTQGLDTSSIEGQNAELTKANQLRDDAIAKEAKLRGGIKNQFDAINPVNALTQIKAKQAADEARKTADQVAKDIAVRNDILSNVGAQTGKSISDILKAASTAGLDIFHVDPASEQNFISRLTDILKQAGTQAGAAGADALNTALGGAADDATQKIKDAFDSAKNLIQAGNALNDANQKVKDDNTQLAELAKQRLTLETDITRKIKDEQLNAYAQIEGVNRSIRDLKEDQADSARAEIRRLQDFAAESKAFDDDRTKAALSKKAADRDAAQAVADYNALVAKQKGLTTASVNLSGLSLDEARSVLANARSNLKAQQDGQTATEKQAQDARDLEAASDRVLSTKISQHEADQAITALNLKQTDAINANVIAIREYGEKVSDNKAQQEQLDRDRTAAQDTYNSLLKGETGIQADLRALKKQIADLDRQRTIDINNQKNAQLELNLAVFTSKNEVNGIADANIAILKNLRDQLPANSALRAEYDRILKILTDAKTAADNVAAATVKAVADMQAAFHNAIPSIQNDLGNITANLKPIDLTVQLSADSVAKIKGDLGNITAGLKPASLPVSVQNTTGTTLPSAPGSVADALTNAARLLLDAAGKQQQTDKNLAELARRTGVSLPSLQAQGDVFTKATNVIVGEAGREVILPLTRQTRMTELLNRPGVLAPILAALPKSAGINLTPDTPKIDLRAAQQANAPLVSSRNSEIVAQQQARKDRQELAENIASETVKALVAAGIGSGDNTFHFQVDQGANKALTEREMQKAVEKAIERSKR